ncbi:MAG: spore coat protein [Candidatus Diapherotrites archaeon]|uniref:glucose-1-phosphate thymidylyltransferase n=1 Tax=Candidatus Iainarchaeum sp. TaxID=3101447 RepID=A0A2D6M012_9ARCH|nr:spore coat protein [Candidatus Diapherotrites archaeon]
MVLRGVILAGGTGSRLLPLTKATNKHLLPIYNKPMIYYPIEMLKSAGIKDILIITGTYHAGDIFSHLGSGKDFGVKFTYRVQDEAGGIPSAIVLAEDFVGDDKFISINGDNIIFESLKGFAEEFEKNSHEMQILLYKGTEDEAKKSGVAVCDGNVVKEVVEKPPQPPSNNIIIGVYFLSPSCFEVIRNVKPSKRGETEITDVQRHYLEKDSLRAEFLKDKWLDAGDFDDLLHANNETKKLEGQK